MICPKCGTENAPGDAFCGSCGAFLEFAAEAAGGSATAGETAVAPVPAALAATPAPAPAPAPAAAAPVLQADAGGSVCSACGRANPAGRRFCISCGERLVAATPAAAGAAASPGEPGKPAWEFPMPTVPVATQAADVRPAAAGAGGRSRLVVGGVIVAVVAIVAVGAAFLAGGGLGGGTTGVVATPSSTAGSGAPSAEPSAGPATAEPTEAATPAATPAATIPPGPSVGIRIADARASSQLKAGRAPKYLFDGTPATAWTSATGKFLGAWVEVRFAPAAITRIQLWPGWQKSESEYYGNHRPQDVTVSFDGGDPVPLALQDVLGAQRIDIPPELGIVHATRLRITIADVFPARKTTAANSPSKVVAISEIRLFGVPAAP